MEEFLEKLNKEELSGSCRDWARPGLLVECCKAGQLSEPSSWMVWYGSAHWLPVQICGKFEDNWWGTIFYCQKGSKLGGKSHFCHFQFLKLKFNR